MTDDRPRMAVPLDAMNGRMIGVDEAAPRALAAAAGQGITTDRPPSNADDAEPAYLAAQEEHDRLVVAVA